jgi:hypothetical protein
MPRTASLRISLGLALGLALATWLCLPPLAMAASPTPAPLASGDVRTGGEGAGLVGAPFLAAAGVVVIGLVAAGLTVVWVRLARGAPPSARP